MYLHESKNLKAAGVAGRQIPGQWGVPRAFSLFVVDEPATIPRMQAKTSYIDKSIQALERLRNVLEPAGIEVTKLHTIALDDVDEKAGVTLSVVLSNTMLATPVRPPRL